MILGKRDFWKLEAVLDDPAWNKTPVHDPTLGTRRLRWQRRYSTFCGSMRFSWRRADA
jgi:hypothetical protein